MKGWTGVVLLALASAPQLAWAAEAKEMQIRHTIVIDATPAEVWAIDGDFVAIDRWLPPIVASRLVLGRNGEVGAIRELTRASGTKATEKLIEFDPAGMSMTYTYVDGTLISSDYFATLSLKPEGNSGTLVVWTARFKRLAYWTDNPPEGQDDATPLKALNTVYPLGLQTLKRIVESRHNSD